METLRQRMADLLLQKYKKMMEEGEGIWLAVFLVGVKSRALRLSLLVMLPLEEVEEWWKNSTRLAKKSNLIEKEQQVVEAYLKIKQKLGIGKM